jgi:putative tricarboxylic transport membrane protein
MVDRVIFVCIIVLAAVYFYATAQIPSLDIGDPLGPKAFPRLLGIGLLVTAGILFLEMWRDAKAAPKRKEKTGPADRRHYMVIGAVVVWTGLCLAVFELLGYVIAMTIYLLALTAYFHRGRWVTNILSSVLFCVGSYAMFNYVLGVSLPKGILPY